MRWGGWGGGGGRGHPGRVLAREVGGAPPGAACRFLPCELWVRKWCDASCPDSRCDKYSSRRFGFFARERSLARLQGDLRAGENSSGVDVASAADESRVGYVSPRAVRANQAAPAETCSAELANPDSFRGSGVGFGNKE